MSLTVPLLITFALMLHGGFLHHASRIVGLVGALALWVSFGIMYLLSEREWYVSAGQSVVCGLGLLACSVVAVRMGFRGDEIEKAEYAGHHVYPGYAMKLLVLPSFVVLALGVLLIGNGISIPLFERNLVIEALRALNLWH